MICLACDFLCTTRGTHCFTENVVLLFRKLADGSVAFKMGNQGAVLCILKPVLTRVDTNGFVLEGWGYNSIHNAVKIMLHEGHDKYDQFVTELEAIKQS